MITPLTIATAIGGLVVDAYAPLRLLDSRPPIDTIKIGIVVIL